MPANSKHIKYVRKYDCSGSHRVLERINDHLRPRVSEFLISRRSVRSRPLHYDFIVNSRDYENDVKRNDAQKIVISGDGRCE